MRSWSMSSIRQFHGCQLAWWFKRTGVEPEFKALALVEGTVLHAVLAFHLQGTRDKNTPTATDALELLTSLYFMEEASGDIRYGKKDRESALERLRSLYRHWREQGQPTAKIISVEERIHVQLPGLDLPLLGYVDLVLQDASGVQVIDHKVSSSRPWPDELLDPWDLQKLAMSHGYMAMTRDPVATFGWSHLVKTKTPQLVQRSLPVAGHRRDAELLRLAEVVNPTLAAMEAVLEGHLAPVPTTAFARMCRTCPFRKPCASYAASSSTSSSGPSSSGRRRSPDGSPSISVS